MRRPGFLRLAVALGLIALIPLASTDTRADDDDIRIKEVTFFETTTGEGFGACPLLDPTCPNVFVITGTLRGDLEGEFTKCLGFEGNPPPAYPRTFGCFEFRAAEDTFRGNFSSFRPRPDLGGRAVGVFAGDNGPNLHAPDGTALIRGEWTQRKPSGPDNFFDQATIVRQEDEEDDDDDD